MHLGQQGSLVLETLSINVHCIQQAHIQYFDFVIRLAIQSSRFVKFDLCLSREIQAAASGFPGFVVTLG